MLRTATLAAAFAAAAFAQSPLTTNYGGGTSLAAGATVYFDLANTGITFLFTGAGYTLLPGVTTYVPPSAAATALTLTDDSETSVALSALLVYPGGTTTGLQVCSNGFVSLAASNGTAFTPAVPAHLNAAQTAWRNRHDYNPGAAGSGAVKFEEANFLGFNQIPAPGLDLGIIGASGCAALIDVSTAVGNLIGNLGLPGVSLSVAFPLPNSTAILGQHVYSQSIWLDATQNTFGALTSNGLDLLVGNV